MRGSGQRAGRDWRQHSRESCLPSRGAQVARRLALPASQPTGRWPLASASSCPVAGLPCGRAGPPACRSPQRRRDQQEGPALRTLISELASHQDFSWAAGAEGMGTGIGTGTGTGTGTDTGTALFAASLAASRVRISSLSRSESALSTQGGGCVCVGGGSSGAAAAAPSGGLSERAARGDGRAAAGRAAGGVPDGAGGQAGHYGGAARAVAGRQWPGAHLRCASRFCDSRRCAWRSSASLRSAAARRSASALRAAAGATWVRVAQLVGGRPGRWLRVVAQADGCRGLSRLPGSAAAQGAAALGQAPSSSLSSRAAGRAAHRPAPPPWPSRRCQSQPAGPWGRPGWRRGARPRPHGQPAPARRARRS
jgi:hypothetical protein